MARFGSLDTQYFDDAGNPLVSGKIYFYETGTTTPKNTYADINYTIANSNPVILTAAGRQPNIFFDGVAKAILTKSDDTQILVRDPVGDTASTFGNAWIASKDYNANDVVQGSDGEFYVSLVNGNVNNNPVTTSGYWTFLYSVEWNSGTTYKLGSVVTYQTIVYQSLQNANLNKNPSTETSWWVPIQLVWSSTATYAINANVVGTDGILYTSLQNANTNHIPASSPSWWVGTSAAAASSASAAATSASNAASSASAASTSASNAATSESNAAASASTASTQATNASNYAAAASTSATNAANSASAASTSASNAAASYDLFDDRYLGAKASDPSVDNDGNPLVTGAMYFNTTSNATRIYNGSGWQDSAAITTIINLATQVTGTLPVANGGTGITSFGAGIATFLGTPSSANLASAVTDETGSGALVFGTSPTLTDPKISLGGTNGTAGQVPVSQGVGLPPVWGAVSSPEVKTPTNVSPASGATNIGATPALTGSTYYSLYGVAMAAAQWQVSTVSNFATTVVNTGDVAGTSITYTVGSGVLSTSTTYYWRVRYKDSNGVYSDWSTATTFTTAASFGPTTIGEAYGGGYYAGKIVQGGTAYYLIVAPKSSGENSSKQWKTSNDAGPTATQTLNNGPAASAAMNSATYPAAQFCESLSIGGYTDWYLPARDELELCYRNLKPTTTANNTSARPKSSYTYPEGNDVSGDTMGINRNSSPTGSAYTSGSPAQTSVSLFQSGGSEAFAADYYWSSSEYSAADAWGQYFTNGTQSNSYKNNSYYVRAVRRLPV